VLVACLAGCGEDPFTPSVASVAGTYVATTFTVTAGGQTTDMLAPGSTVTIELSESGTTSGRLFVPGGAEGGADFEADLTGTWSLSGGTVTFTHSADTFIRDVVFTAEPHRLRTVGTFSGVTITLVLTK
jgi:hypothetical protein